MIAAMHESEETLEIRSPKIEPNLSDITVCNADLKMNSSTIPTNTIIVMERIKMLLMLKSGTNAPECNILYSPQPKGKPRATARGR